MQSISSLIPLSEDQMKQLKAIRAGLAAGQ